MAKKNYLLDTSVYLTDADSIFQFENNDIFVPLKVFYFLLFFWYPTEYQTNTKVEYQHNTMRYEVSFEGPTGLRSLEASGSQTLARP